MEREIVKNNSKREYESINSVVVKGTVAWFGFFAYLIMPTEVI
jgi:hypothetical protein